MWNTTPSRPWWASSGSKNKPEIRGWWQIWKSHKFLPHFCSMTCCSSHQGEDFLSPPLKLGRTCDLLWSRDWEGTETFPAKASRGLASPLNTPAALSPPCGARDYRERPRAEGGLTDGQQSPPGMRTGCLGLFSPGWATIWLSCVSDPKQNSQNCQLSPVQNCWPTELWVNEV